METRCLCEMWYIYWKKKVPFYNNLISFMSENGCYFSGEKRTVPSDSLLLHLDLHLCI